LTATLEATEAPSLKVTGEKSLVGAPAFMRGKERLSAPGKSLDVDHALERWFRADWDQLPLAIQSKIKNICTNRGSV
jgi:hypothetical protein